MISVKCKTLMQDNCKGRNAFALSSQSKKNYSHLFSFFFFSLNETGLFTTTKIEDRYDAFVEQELAWLPVFVK